MSRKVTEMGQGMKKWRKSLACCLTVALLAFLTACTGAQGSSSTAGAEPAPAATAQNDAGGTASQESGQNTEADQAGAQTEVQVLETAEAGQTSAQTESPAGEQESSEKNGDVIILYTSDIHCGVDQGFDLIGLRQVRDSLEAQGYTTILVDDGDAIQGEVMGTVTKGEAMIELMNAMKYDIAIPGNHEFDYGMDQFLGLTKQAEFPYISCNFEKEGELVFAPYIIKEAAGMRIAFVGVTTPRTLTASTPVYFQNENGEYIYGFMQDDSGEKLYSAVQKAVDDARAEGADYVYIMAHLGLEESCRPWTYAEVISHTNGIDVFLDGHSHDTEQVTMLNKDGKPVVRSACGTKMEAIGYSRISATDGIVETNIWRWQNKDTVPKLFGLRNSMSDEMDTVIGKINEATQKVIGKTEVDLTINDPVETDSSGKPIRMIRRAETNLGDLIADSVRVQTGADIGIVGGGGIRVNIGKGDITYNAVLAALPFQNQIAVVRVNGQQVIDALEWGAKSVPGETGGFLQVSGLSYEIDASIPSGCRKNENGLMTAIEGERRVRNVMVGDAPIDPEKQYTVASNEYVLLRNGDGTTAFDGAEVVVTQFKLDSQILIDYIVDDLGGVVGSEYADPYGQGRIKIIE